MSKHPCTISKPRISIKGGQPMFNLVGGPEVVRDYEDWGYTEESARRMAACWNACKDEDTAMLEEIVRSGTTIRKRHDEALSRANKYQVELGGVEIERNRLREHLASPARAVELYTANGTNWPELIAANKLIEELGKK